MGGKTLAENMFGERLQRIIDERKIQKQELARIGEVSSTSMTAYLKGRTLPSQDTLEKWAKAYGLNGTWLLTGRGPMYEDELYPAPRSAEPLPPGLGDKFSAENDAGQLIGDLLWEIIGLWGMSQEDFAKKARIPLTDMENIMASRRPPTWDELTKMAKRCRINPLHLLLGEDPSVLARDLLGRLEAATGLAVHDAFALAWAFGVNADEVKAWMRSKGAKTRLPNKWMSNIIKEYHLNPAWLLRGMGRTHLNARGVDEAVRMLGEYPEQGEFPLQKAADDHTTYGDGGAGPAPRSKAVGGGD